MNDDKYVSMTALGKRFGVSSHTVGRALKDRGVRLPNGEPTPNAIQAGLVARRPTPRQEWVMYWVWHEDLTPTYLIAAGLEESDG